MILELLAKIVFYGFILLFSLFSFAMIYTLLRYGKSLALGLIMSAVYVVIIVSLYATALVNFNRLNFPEF
mgnify:CR=1 FL=1